MDGIGVEDFLNNEAIEWTKNFTILNGSSYSKPNGSTNNRPTVAVPVRPPAVPVLPPAVPFSSPILAASPKKGVGWNRWDGRNVSVLNSLNISWYYSWGINEASGSTSVFIPMAYSGKRISSLPVYSSIAFGFNEPDNVKQSNMTVAEAIRLWPTLRFKVGKLGSPATARDPVVAGSWLEQFMERRGNQTDFVTTHWYKGTNYSRFKNDIRSLCNKFNKPVWVTEFAPQTVGSALLQPYKYSQSAVISFMIKVTKWMNNNSCVAGYAWHDARYGTSALYNSTVLNSLSETGKAYAAIN